MRALSLGERDRRGTRVGQTGRAGMMPVGKTKL